MAFTRFNYDYQEHQNYYKNQPTSRYMLNKPGNGDAPAFFEDPYSPPTMSANIRSVPNSTPVDIASGRTRRLTKAYTNSEFPNAGVQTSYKNLTTQQAFTDETRYPPVWMYRDLEQPDEISLLNPQENVCKTFHNNVNTRF